MENILIFPYSGTGIEALDCLDEKWLCLGFVSDDPNIIGTRKYGIQIYGRDAFTKFPEAKVLAVHGSASSFRNRQQVLSSLNLPAFRFATVIHPNAAIGRNAVIGINVLIMAGVVITSNAIVSDNVVILPNSVIHHDSVVGEFSLIASNVTIPGNVQIGKCCYIGASSSIKNGITIGNNTLVGMGTNVTKSFGDGLVVVGNPAKVF
jgi:sugar O-acyltransferase (sialic acid O-acetyltransferase NeuD family)